MENNIIFAYDKKNEIQEKKHNERKILIEKWGQADSIFEKFIEENNQVFNQLCQTIVNNGHKFKILTLINVLDANKYEPNESKLFAKLISTYFSAPDVDVRYEINSDMKTYNLTITMGSANLKNLSTWSDVGVAYYKIYVNYINYRIWSKIKDGEYCEYYIYLKQDPIHPLGLKLVKDTVINIFKQYGYDIEIAHSKRRIKMIKINFNDASYSFENGYKYKWEKEQDEPYMCIVINEGEKNECIVCKEKISDRYRKKCGHYIHFKCLKETLKYDNEIKKYKFPLVNYFSKRNTKFKYEVYRQCPVCREIIINGNITHQEIEIYRAFI